MVSFTPFTGFSYATGLASLGQGLNRLSDAWQQDAEREMFAKAFAGDPQAMALARAGQPGLAAQSYWKSQDQKRDERAANIAGGIGGLGGGTSSGGGAGPYAGAISSIESGGRYDALGPVTKTGDRAYGKYQVMGANIPTWTQEVLGRSMTPQEFVSSPQAQDAVFKAKFGQYAQKYGPEGAARAWFAGEGGMNDLGRRDQLGTSVGDYGRRFAAGLGGQPAQAGQPAQPYRVASTGPAAPSGAPSQTGTPPTPEEIKAAAADGFLPPDTLPEFVIGHYQREPRFRSDFDQWRAQRAGMPAAPQQVAGAGRFPTPAEYDAAADAIRVGREGGPRLVLSPQSPLNPGGAPPAQPAPIQDDPSIPNDGPGKALAYNRPPQAPSPQVAGANPADMPVPGATPVSQERFTIPGTNETVPAAAAGRLQEIRRRIDGPGVETPEMQALKEQSVRYRQAAAVASPAQRPMYMQAAQQAEQEYRQRLTQQQQIAREEYRDEITNLRTLAKEEREAARREAEGPTELVKEFVWARRNGMTQAKSPAEYAREKAKVAEPKDPTEGQANANIYARRMEEAEQVLSAPGVAAASVDPRNRIAATVPFVGNFMVSEDFQRADQAQRDFINASLRRESGAAIAASEFENAKRQYFPQPGDSETVLRQKARNRQTQIEGIRAAAGRAYTREAPAQRPVPPTEQVTQRTAAPSRAELEAEARRRGLIQ